MQNKINLEELIISAIEEKKGSNISVIDLEGIDRAICNKLIICEGSSTTQTEAISQFIEEKVSEQVKSELLAKCGYDNCLWIVLDYFDIVVHVFVPKYREQINIEELWLDGKLKKLN
jgi:ribosome-associated protein